MSVTAGVLATVLAIFVGVQLGPELGPHLRSSVQAAPTTHAPASIEITELSTLLATFTAIATSVCPAPAPCVCEPVVCPSETPPFGAVSVITHVLCGTALGASSIIVGQRWRSRGAGRARRRTTHSGGS